jgi:hypothetical protein
VLGYAARRSAAAAASRDARATRRSCMNPQGLEEFGATDPSRAPLKRAPTCRCGDR